MSKKENFNPYKLIEALDYFTNKYIHVAIDLLHKKDLTAEEQRILDITDEIQEWRDSYIRGVK